MDAVLARLGGDLPPAEQMHAMCTEAAQLAERLAAEGGAGPAGQAGRSLAERNVLAALAARARLADRGRALFTPGEEAAACMHVQLRRDGPVRDGRQGHGRDAACRGAAAVHDVDAALGRA